MDIKGIDINKDRVTLYLMNFPFPLRIPASI